MARKVDVTVTPIKAAVLSAALLGGWVVSTPDSAAQTEDGGVLLTFGVALRLEAQDNRALAPVSAGNSFEASVPLSFGLTSETRASRLALDLGGVLRQLDGPGTANDISGFQTPSAALAYERSSAGARFTLGASLRDTELSDGTVLSEDGLQLISGSATQRITTLETSLNWRENTRLGFGVLARISDTEFSGGVARDLDGTRLNDSRRTTLQASVRADLTTASRLNMSLTLNETETDGAVGRRETLAFASTLTVDRPRGAVTGSLNVTETQGDPRISANLGRRLAFPAGELSAQVGVTRGAGGDISLTGAADLRRDLPRGTVNLGLSRSVGTSEDTGTERLSTRVNLNYLQQLTPLSNLSLGLTWAEVEDTGTGTSARNAGLSATYNRELSPDWGLNLGYRYRFNDSDTNAAAHSNAVFLELRRDFLTRF